VAYHVEIRRGRRWAREFNLSEATLRESVLDPWVRGRPVSLGDREWQPAECDLRVLEGPELSSPDLAFGRGWGAAERSGRDVARELIGGAAREASRVAVLAETDASRAWIAETLAELGLESVPWSNALLAGGDESRPVAVVLAVESSEPGREWLYEAGAAVGALGGRAVVVRLAPGPPPPELEALETIDPGGELGPRLAAALERAGI
jgi:hypothetical protein